MTLDALRGARRPRELNDADLLGWNAKIDGALGAFPRTAGSARWD